MPRPPKPEDYRSAQQRAGLSNNELWLLYFTLGGKASAMEIEAFGEDLHEIGAYQRDILSHALNERLVELGEEELLSYQFDAR